MHDWQFGNIITTFNKLTVAYTEYYANQHDIIWQLLLLLGGVQIIVCTQKQFQLQTAHLNRT